MLTVKHVVRKVVPRKLRNWLRQPGRSLEWAWGETRFLFGSRLATEILPGWKLICHPLAYQHGFKHQLEGDDGQEEEFANYVRECRPGMILFDLGAHYGLFSLGAMHYGGPEAWALAVDASPHAVRMIEIHARLNRVEDRLRALHACMCDHGGTEGMVATGLDAQGFFISPDADHGPSEQTAVPALTLDDLVERYGKRPTHVKIDVEGYEASVLRGGRSVLTREPAPLLFLEIHNMTMQSRGQDPGQVADLLEQFRYRSFSTAGAPLDRQALLGPPVIRVVCRRCSVP
jgi:FkbM family methyltransferase